MTSERVVRRLAAILAADVVGYSRLMGRDENGTLVRLKAHRTVRFEPALVRHGGRLVKLTGDGALAEFPSAVDGLGAAIEFQQAMAEANQNQPEDTAIVFRIGLHLGDLIVDGDDLYGDGVNVAARLEAEAPAGGIVISGDMYNAVIGRLKAAFDDIGSLALKNIERPIQVFRVGWNPADWQVEAVSAPQPSADALPPFLNAPLALPNKPSIAVLPFQNMSSDPEQEFFADGMTEDIITSLSKLRDVLVIARNSTFTYKGKSVDVKRVGQELGVRYVLEGSVRKAGNRLRITGQLIETTTGSHLWADRWDCGIADIFEAQDQITARIHNAIGDTLVRKESSQISRLGAANIQAWQMRMQAWDGFYRWDREGCLRGVDLGRQATVIEPSDSDGCLVTSLCLYAAASSGWVQGGRGAMEEALALSSRAVNLDADNAMAHTALGLILLSFGRHDEAVSEAKHGSDLAPGSYYVSLGTGLVLGYCGEPQESLSWFDQAIRASPRDPRLFTAYQSRCVPLFCLDRYDDVIAGAQLVMRQVPNWTEAFTMQATAYARLGRLPEARKAIEHLLHIDSQYSINRALRRHPFRDQAQRDKLADALRQAGLE
jgi:adenylate cyclase